MKTPLLKNLAKYGNRALFFLLIAVFLLAQNMGSTVSAEELVCNEARLRNLGIATIGCVDDTNKCGVGSGAGAVLLTGGEGRKQAFEYLLKRGLNVDQTAGVIGNLMVESGVNPINEEKKGQDAGGKGIAQWTATRRVDFESKARAAGVLTREADYEALKASNPTAAAEAMQKALQFNLDYLWNEATQRGDIDKLKSEGTSVEAAVISWEKWYERAGVPALGLRLDEANKAKADFAGLAGGIGSGTTPGAPAGTGAAGAQKTVVVLDPGHGQGKPARQDPATTLNDTDYYNTPEAENVFATAELVKGKLEPAGYTVLLTKSSAKDSKYYRERSDVAKLAGASIAVSIHHTAGGFDDPNFKWVTPQVVGGYRISQYTGKKVEFTNQQTATASQSYANIMVEERTKAEGKPAQIHALNFDAREGLDQGNMAMVQLMSDTVPWVYNEVGADGFNAEKYAEGIANGIKRAVPVGSNTNTNCAAAPASASKVVEIALSQVGIQENSEECKKYFNNKNSCATPWCAAFAGWVYAQAGMPVGGGYRAKGVGQWFSENKFFFKWQDPYSPQPGDIFVKGRGTGTGWGGNGHIGIVVSVNGFTIETVEGNSSNQVKKNTYQDYRSIPELIGFGRYADPGSVSQQSDFNPSDGVGGAYDSGQED